jgi:urea transport system ATP-binding protein
MGLIPAKTGEVLWQGKKITHSKPHQRVQSGVAYVPQGREIFPRLTVEENLLLGYRAFLRARRKTSLRRSGSSFRCSKR